MDKSVCSSSDGFLPVWRISVGVNVKWRLRILKDLTPKPCCVGLDRRNVSWWEDKYINTWVSQQFSVHEWERMSWQLTNRCGVIFLATLGSDLNPTAAPYMSDICLFGSNNQTHNEQQSAGPVGCLAHVSSVTGWIEPCRVSWQDTRLLPSSLPSLPVSASFLSSFRLSAVVSGELTALREQCLSCRFSLYRDSGRRTKDVYRTD